MTPKPDDPRNIASRLEDLIQAMPDIVYFKDAEGRNLIVNRAFETAFGLRRDDVVGRTDAEILPSDLAAACKASDDSVFQSGAAYHFEEEATGPDGKVVHFDTIKAPIRDAGGGIAGLIGVSRDITLRKTMEKALQASEERFRGLYENATLGIYQTGADGRILMANPALLRMLGYDSLEELAARNLEEEGFQPLYPRSEFKARMERDGEIRGLESAWTRRDGSIVHIRESAKAVRNESGRIVRYEGTVEDISGRLNAEAERRRADERYRHLIENSLEGVYRTAPDGRLLSANPAMWRMFGFDSAEEFLNANIRDFYVDPDQRAHLLDAMQKDGVVRNMELHLRRKDGTGFYVLVNARAVRAEDGTMAFEGILTDFTAQKETERRLEAALAEKDVLLKEVHHRVKNNLQVISSLLSLQSRFLKHPDDVDQFRESQRRIRSMALIHERLYQSKSLSKIEFASYIKRLAESLVASQLRGDQRIGLRTDLEEITLDIQTAIPCGLIVNELIMNALKHGFPAGRGGSIRLGLRADPDGTITLAVGDDGVGLPLGVDVLTSESMGMQIVAMLTEQIEGRLEVDRSSGTEFRLSFRELRYKQRI